MEELKKEIESLYSNDKYEEPVGKKPFFQMVVVERSYLNPLRYILGKEKIIWAQTITDYYSNLVDLNVDDIKFVDMKTGEN